MHKFFLIVSLLITMATANGLDTSSSKHELDFRIDHLVREQFYTAAILFPVYRKFIVEAEYGYLYYHRAAANIGYRFDHNNFKPFLKTGIVFQRENFTSRTHYNELYWKLGGGVEADLSHNFFLNVETSLLNYLKINYSMRKIKYRETYVVGSEVDYAVIVGIGYRFRF